MSVLLNLHFLPQPTAAVAPKGSKGSKSGYDDTTLPLMEKNQGASCWSMRDRFITQLGVGTLCVYTVDVAPTVFFYWSGCGTRFSQETAQI